MNEEEPVYNNILKQKMKEEAEDAGGEQGGGVVASPPALEYSPRSRTSEFINRYNDLLGEGERLPAEKMREQLLLAGIEYDPALEADHFEMRILRQSRGGQGVSMWVKLGGFSMEVSVYQCDEPSPLHGGHCLYGSCGNVYLLEVGDSPELAAKCIEFRPADPTPEERLRTVLRSIKEYCLAKVACALQIGPKLVRFQNWDLIVRKRCIQFWMERCCLEEEVVLSDQSRNTLQASLRILHSLQIAHCDVKTNNILFSPSFHKLVFIDFGVSRLLSESPGHTTPTRFVGTLETSSPAMAALLANCQVGYVDLYYNDAFAFSKSLLGDPSRETKTPLEDIIRYFHPEQKQFDLPRIQYFLFHDETTEAIKLLKKMKGDSILPVLSFFSQLPLTMKLRQFYQQHIARQWGDSMRFRDLWQNYRFSCSCHVEVSLRHRQEDYWRCNAKNREFYSLLTQQSFSLWALDNEDRLARPTPKQQNVYDTFLAKVTLTRRKRRKATAAFLEKEVDEFIKSENVRNVQGDYADRLRSCLDHLIDLCLSKLSEGWTVKLLEQVLQQRVFLGPFLNFQRINYYSRLFAWNGQQSVRSNCMLAIMKCNLLALSLYDYDPKFHLTAAQDNELEQHYTKWSLSNMSDRGGKYDYLLIKAMEHNAQLIELSTLEKECLNLAWTDERKLFLLLLRVKALKKEKRLQRTRLLLSNILRTNHNGQHLQPEHLLLAKVYCQLKDYSQAKEFISFADAILVHPQVSRRCLFDNRLFMELTNPNCQLTLYRHLSILRPAKLADLLLYSFYTIQSNYEKIPEICLRFYRKIALCLSPDPILDLILQTGKVNETQIMLSKRLNDQLKDNCEKASSIKLEESLRIQQICHLWRDGQYEQVQFIVERELSVNRSFNISRQAIVFDYYLRILLAKRQIYKLENALRHFHDDILRDPDRLEWWIGQLSVSLLFRLQAHRGQWLPFRQILCILVELVEVHPTSANIQAYMRCLRYAFCRPLDLVMLSTALPTLSFMGQQWRQPYFSLFQLEAIAKLANILNTTELRSLLWKSARSWPFLPSFTVNFCLQQHLSLLLAAPLKPRFKIYLLKTARKLPNFSPNIAHNVYYMCQILVKNEAKAIEDVIQEGICPKLVLIRKQPTARGQWTNTRQGKQLEAKLKQYHINAQNLHLRSVPSKQRLRLDID